MGKYKFKVGDKVKVVEAGNGCSGVNDMVGYITDEENSNGLFEEDDGINIKIEGTDRVWRINPDAELELISKKKNETIIIYRNDRKVIALDKTTGKKTEASCNPTDKFDFHTGAKLAFQRLVGEENAVADVREVKRPAKSGEYIKIVDGKSLTGLYKNVDICMALITSDNVVIMEKDGHLNGCARHDEYVVLENYKPEEKKEDDTKKICVGDMIEVVDLGKVYSYFDSWSGLKGGYDKHFVRGINPENKMIAKVLKIAKHDMPFITEDLVIIQNPKTTQVFIIGINGIKKVER